MGACCFHAAVDISNRVHGSEHEAARGASECTVGATCHQSADDGPRKFWYAAGLTTTPDTV